MIYRPIVTSDTGIWLLCLVSLYRENQAQAQISFLIGCLELKFCQAKQTKQWTDKKKKVPFQGSFIRNGNYMKITPKTTKTPKKKNRTKWVRFKYPSRPEVFEAFSEWMIYPKSVRNPKTQGAFAIKHEVSPDTLSDYKKKPEFWEKVQEKRREMKMKIADAILLSKINFEEIELMALDNYNESQSETN